METSSSQIFRNEEPEKPQSKVTLSQLQRFLPLAPPDALPCLPTAASQFLASPSFNNISLKDQKRIKSRYATVYRSHFNSKDIVEHLHKLTASKFTSKSLMQAITDAAASQGLIDWYFFARKVGGRSKLVR